jgi:hypothetical protein
MKKLIVVVALVVVMLGVFAVPAFAFGGSWGGFFANSDCTGALNCTTVGGPAPSASNECGGLANCSQILDEDTCEPDRGCAFVRIS